MSRSLVLHLALLLAVWPLCGLAQSLTDGQVAGVLDRWVATQNSGDFAAYSRLYSSRFYGVKRAGHRRSSFDRGGWLVDREPMFSGPIRVEATGVSARLAGTSAVVNFEQRWRSKAFEDVGRKRLVIVLEGGAARISREEMLSSKVIREASGAAKSLPLEAFAFVLQADGPAMVLSTEAPACAEGTARLRRGPLALDCAPATPLAKRWARWEGRKVRGLGGVSGCEAVLEPPTILVRYTPHFGQTAAWRGMGRGRVVEEAVAQSGPADRFIVARFRDIKGDCSGVKWATTRARPVPKPFARVPIDPKLRAAAMAAYRGSNGWKKIQSAFLADGRASSKSALWDSAEARQPTVRLFRAANGHAFVYVGRQTGGCGDFGGAQWGIWTVRGERLSPWKRAPSAEGYFEPLAAIDFDGDGNPELLGPREVLRWRNGRLHQVHELVITSYDCPC